MNESTPGGIWIVPAMIGMWALSLGIRWGITRWQRRRRGWGDWDHIFGGRRG